MNWNLRDGSDGSDLGPLGRVLALNCQSRDPAVQRRGAYAVLGPQTFR
jgi:hypothetical protein